MSEPQSRIPADSAEATRDLQDRIGRFARIIFMIAVFMLVASLILEAVTGRLSLHENLESPGRVAHVVATVVLLGTWRVCRGRTLGVHTLEALDAALTFVLCSCWAMLGVNMRSSEPIEFSILLAMTHTLVARSVVVPSSFGRTAAIGAAATVPTMTVLVHRGMPFVIAPTPTLIRTFLFFSLLWCIVAVFTTAVSSRQLYGLRQRIREVGKLGQYTLEDKIGEGGMGVVYRATHAMMRRPAAIKLLLPDRAGEKDLARFEREVQLTSQLAHPNTISIFDYGRTADGVFYYVMEYLDGFDLERLVDEEGPIAPARAIHILVQASGALAEAHALGLIHRDIKPANIVITQRPDEPDVVKVVDFGLVKTLGSTTNEPAVTNVNAITGTPMYLAPEAITSPETVDARSDIYALGAVAYYLLTGQHVFDAPTIVEVCSMHLLEIPVPPSRRLGRELPADLEALVLACLAKPREARPASAEVLRASLLACADAARYDVAAARAWWADRGAKLRAKTNATRVKTGTATMAIDLRGRAAG
jgi:serine/threonine-protein kinase